MADGKFTVARVSLGTVIAAKRKSLRITQEALAFECGMDRTYVSDIERGEGNPSLVSILKICNALNIPAAQLLEKAGIQVVVCEIKSGPNRAADSDQSS